LCHTIPFVTKSIKQSANISSVNPVSYYAHVNVLLMHTLSRLFASELYKHKEERMYRTDEWGVVAEKVNLHV